MRLTRFTDYSLRVLIYLGQNTQNRVTIQQISEEYDISKNHLMKVVSNLTRHEFVAARRGPGGGIRLNRPAEEIGLNEIIQRTEKHIKSLDDTVALNSAELSPTHRLGTCLNFALQSYLQVLGQFTLADILSADPIATQLISPD